MPYKDTWKRKLTRYHRAAYGVMTHSGRITVTQVKYYPTAGITTVEYYSKVPHDQIKKEMRELVQELEAYK